MNKAVVEYYKSDLKKTNTFKKQLADICAQVGLCSTGTVHSEVMFRKLVKTTGK